MESQDDDHPERRIIKAAELPRHPIPKSAVTTCMLAYIIVAKFCDALPLYRQEKILARYGGSVTRTTMANWLMRLSRERHLNISNAAAENAICPFTVGRRNWLFADTPKGAKAIATYYSLIESAKANGLEPFEYPSHILKELPYADTVEKLEQLLPWAVKASKG
ncbi:IS66 family transposase [Endozoicomonas acroporae]|uniref:IS66 family transposase n=1 Tax=Endozoicomonas acroporae TaxID=1701104 RepID=UPI003D7C02A6